MDITKGHGLKGGQGGLAYMASYPTEYSSRVKENLDKDLEQESQASIVLIVIQPIHAVLQEGKLKATFPITVPTISILHPGATTLETACR